MTLADILTRPFRSEVGEPLCTRCGRVTERPRPAQGYPSGGVTVRCGCGEGT